MELIVIDINGNSSNCIVIVNVVDNIVLIIKCYNFIVVIELDGDFEFMFVDVYDVV